ncbi:MAG TPA: deoxyguanosinetriphosphate triphosphohydrolase [Bryobacteraceae bacterium]|nr:deoxyguanosinetriphosphate triphosphohydrolase [Bryobacteraceae bacterium]
MNGPGCLRFPVAQSRGRRYPEVAHPYRNEFQRDRDRIIHCHAFRRLENKTQVFPAGVSDHFRNRLTHTIEVAQIARTVASALDLNEDLTEALALGHDIGHPPFAHAGEEELDRQMRRFGERFDHNLHALHIVESFEHRYARFPGLNLTFEVREGIAKHSRDFEKGENPALDEYLPGLRPPLEAQLIDLADEVAYNTADLDDAFSARLLQIDDARAAVPEFNRKYEEAEGQFPGATDRDRCQEVVRALVDELVSGLIQGTAEAVQSAGVTNVEEIRAHPRRLAAFPPAVQAANRALKQFLHHAVYFSEAMVEARRRSAGMVAALFDFYVAHPEALPESYVESLSRTPLHRIVCDYIAGMTDGFFLRTYQQALGES